MRFDPDKLLDPDFHASIDCQALWKQMRRKAPAFRHAEGKYPAFVSVTRYEDVRRVYSEPATFSSEPGVLLRPVAQGTDPGAGLTLALSDSPRHREIRVVLAPLFANRNAKPLTELVQRRVTSLFSQFEDASEFDFSQDFATRFALFVTCDILGLPTTSHELVLKSAVAAFRSGTSVLSQGDFLQCLTDFIEERRANPEDDLTSTLLTAKTPQGAPRFSTLEVLLNCENLIGATENAGLSIASAVAALMDSAEQRALLAAKPDLMKPAIEELLRLASCATHSMRTVVRPTTVGAENLVPGDKVVVWLPSANRDETEFEDPDRLDIRRRAVPHLALGGGPHTCIGGAVARLEISAVLTELLNRGWNIHPTREPVPVRSIAVNGPAKMPVRFV